MNTKAWGFYETDTGRLCGVHHGAERPYEAPKGCQGAWIELAPAVVPMEDLSSELVTDHREVQAPEPCETCGREMAGSDGVMPSCGDCKVPLSLSVDDMWSIAAELPSHWRFAGVPLQILDEQGQYRGMLTIAVGHEPQIVNPLRVDA